MFFVTTVVSWLLTGIISFSYLLKLFIWRMLEIRCKHVIEMISLSSYGAKKIAIIPISPLRVAKKQFGFRRKLFSR